MANDIYVEINDIEKLELENKIFNGYTYSRKRAAYSARAEYYSRFDKEEWGEMVSFFNYVCCNCECEVIGGLPTKDHIIPITYGGTSHIRNMQPLCRECNTGNVKCSDYRNEYCERNGLILPSKWQHNG